MHWGSYVEDSIASSVSCLYSSLLEGSFAVQEVVGSNLGRDMSRNALLKDVEIILVKFSIVKVLMYVRFFRACAATVTS